MAKSTWQYYQWYPRDFMADRTVRKLDGLVIAILRAFHDQLWMSQDKAIPDNDQGISTMLDINTDTWLAAKRPLLASGALYREGGCLRSPHIDDCWRHCSKISKTASGNRAKGAKLLDTD